MTKFDLEENCRICEKPRDRADHVIPRMENALGPPQMDGTWICGDHIEEPSNNIDTNNKSNQQ